MATKEEISRVKDIDMIGLAWDAGLRARKNRDHIKISCIFHGPERIPSLAVYEGHFYCFGCNVHGDVIAFAKKLWDCSFHEAVKILINYMDEHNL